MSYIQSASTWEKNPKKTSENVTNVPRLHSTVLNLGMEPGNEAALTSIAARSLAASCTFISHSLLCSCRRVASDPSRDAYMYICRSKVILKRTKKFCNKMVVL